MTTVRLGLNRGQLNYVCKTSLSFDNKPALLVAYPFLRGFQKAREHYSFRDWALDSGAFSVHSRGIVIDLWEYIEVCKDLIASDPMLTEIFALDVIGDYKQSLANTERMIEAGVPAIPTYHLGEPLDYLKHLSDNFPKIAIGGVARKHVSVKRQFAAAVFSRIWPKKIHGFGYGAEALIMEFPFHSTDSTNWELAPCGFGRWLTYGQLSWKGIDQNLRVEVEYYLKVERQAQSRWRKDMLKLNETDDYPQVRLAWTQDCGSRQEVLSPQIRLSVMPTGQELKALGGKKTPPKKKTPTKKKES